MIILGFHVVAAVVTTGAIIAVLVAARRRSTSISYPAMILSFGLTALSGVGLVFISGGLGRLCLMMTSYALVVALTARYYRRELSLSSL